MYKLSLKMVQNLEVLKALVGELFLNHDDKMKKRKAATMLNPNTRILCQNVA
jgi:hypothetical protein